MHLLLRVVTGVWLARWLGVAEGFSSCTAWMTYTSARDCFALRIHVKLPWPAQALAQFTAPHPAPPMRRLPLLARPRRRAARP